MTTTPKYCPVCYQDLKNLNPVKEKQINGVKVVIHCPKCKTILNCDSERTEVRCPNCQKLFASVLDYSDHCISGLCYQEIVRRRKYANRTCGDAP